MFLDSPSERELKGVISKWTLPDLTGELAGLESPSGTADYWGLCSELRRKMKINRSSSTKGRLEKAVINWLYAFIRMNIKRGPVFDLRQVLREGSADCLGYGKLFTTLGRLCGLETGIVEVLVDNRGRSVPHSAVLVKLAGGRPRFIDFWYGSTDIRHKRLGLQVRRGGRWQVEDMDFRDMLKTEAISYLPDACVDAITCYILGNRAFKDADFKQAVSFYNKAISLYPWNARSYYNRGLAYENLHLAEKAQADYARAVQDEASLVRILAAQPEDVTALMLLDQLFIPEVDQQIYLMNAGYSSGRMISPSRIAEKLDIPVKEVEAVLDIIQKVLG